MGRLVDKWIDGLLSFMCYLPNFIIDLKSITNAIRKRVALYENTGERKTESECLW